MAKATDNTKHFVCGFIPLARNAVKFKQFGSFKPVSDEELNKALSLLARRNRQKCDRIPRLLSFLVERT